MITTSKFNYIHIPKTGGTFVTEMLFQVYQLKISFKKPSYNETPLGFVEIHGEKHARAKQIPDKYKDLPILTIIRNPLDFYVSNYEYQMWKRKDVMIHYEHIKDFSERFKNFPNLSFQEFLELEYAAYFPDFIFKDEKDLGLATVRYFSFIGLDVKSISDKIKSDTISKKKLKSMFPSNIHFLYTHRLNKDLYEFLKQKGFPEKRIKFILEKEKVLPKFSRREKYQLWQKYYTRELKDLMLKKDRLLFLLFPELLSQI